MGLTPTHGLRQQKNALIGAPSKPVEGFPEKRLHATGDVIGSKKLMSINTIFHQVGEIQDGIPSALVEYALSDGAELL
jgi:hypothetical protein